MKKRQLTLFLFLASALTTGIITYIPLAAGQYGPYLGNSNRNNPPSFKFYQKDGTEIFSVGNYNVAFLVQIGARENTMHIPGGGITSVSYKASWENKTKQLWQWSINDPANLSDDDPNAKVSFFYAIDLSDAPEGSHKIEIFVTGVVYGWNCGYSTVSTNGSVSFHFSVIAPPSTQDAPDTGNSSLVWDPQTIADMGAGAYIFNSPLVVLDSNDTPHIVYSKIIDFPESNHRFIIHSSWNGFNWTFQTVGLGTPYSLVLDDNEILHFVHGFTGNIDYTTFNGTNWVTQSIESIGSGIGNVFGEIVLDSSGKPHVAYSIGNTIKYATPEGSNWTIQTIDEIESEHKDPIHLSLALDQNDTPQVLYGYPSPYQDKISNETIATQIVKLAVYENSNWNIQTIPLSQPINGYANLVLDSKGNPHFICSQLEVDSTGETLSKLLHVNWDGKAWKAQDAVSNVTLGGTYSGNSNWVDIGYLALDSNDYPKMCYIDNGTLMYASWRGKSWKITSIDPKPQAGESGFLVLDSNDNPHISYIGPRAHTNWLSYSYADVRYANSTAANGLIEPEEPPSQNYSIEITATILIAVAVTGLAIYLKIHKPKIQVV